MIMTIGVRGCARCGHDHRDMLFDKLERPIDDPDGDFTHWAACPTNGQPILMRVNGSGERKPRRSRQLAVAFAVAWALCSVLAVVVSYSAYDHQRYFVGTLFTLVAAGACVLAVTT